MGCGSPSRKKPPVVMDPELSSGAPTVEGVRPEALAELVDVGEPIEEVAEAFGLEVPRPPLPSDTISSPPRRRERRCTTLNTDTRTVVVHLRSDVGSFR